MKQKIADGIVKWLCDEAPTSVMMIMTPEMIRELTQSICDQLEVEDFEKISEDKPR